MSKQQISWVLDEPVWASNNVNLQVKSFNFILFEIKVSRKLITFSTSRLSHPINENSCHHSLLRECSPTANWPSAPWYVQIADLWLQIVLCSNTLRNNSVNGIKRSFTAPAILLKSAFTSRIPGKYYTVVEIPFLTR